MSEEMRDTLVKIKMLDAGIIPYGGNGSALGEAFQKLDSVTKRKMKRKFRKLWRKASGIKRRPDQWEKIASYIGLGLPKNKIGQRQKHNRSATVFFMFLDSVIEELNSGR
tara:strand:+ start:115 stop:444 length:330 start_codon:yes stop_codon:yes gene_type:complete